MNIFHKKVINFNFLLLRVSNETVCIGGFSLWKKYITMSLKHISHKFFEISKIHKKRKNAYNWVCAKVMISKRKLYLVRSKKYTANVWEYREMHSLQSDNYRKTQIISTRIFVFQIWRNMTNWSNNKKNIILWNNKRFKIALFKQKYEKSKRFF